MYMPLDYYEQQVQTILNDVTGYNFIKNYDNDEEAYYYDLIDIYGDVDGDPFFEFGDLVDYICNNSDVEEEVAKLNNYMEK